MNPCQVGKRKNRKSIIFGILCRNWRSFVACVLGFVHAADRVAGLAWNCKAAARRRNLIAFNTRKHTNEAVYNTVDAHKNALQQKCNAFLRYFDLNGYDERVFEREGERYLMNPIGLFYHKEKASATYHEVHITMVLYRADRMADVQIEDKSVARVSYSRKYWIISLLYS